MTVTEKVLAIMERHRGEYISGQDLAEHLGVSRTAIWKATMELKDRGYEIDGVRNKGYKLGGDLDRLNRETIRYYLDEKSKKINIIIVDEIDSTNDLAKRMHLEGTLKQGDVVLAEKQTAGKGRRGKSFDSPKYGGIYMTILYRESEIGISPDENLLPTVRAAVAVAKAIEELTDLKPEIKWVNDIYIDGKKVCGILTEADLDVENGRFTAVYIGIGINVHTPKEEFSEDVRDIAGSLNRDIFRNRLIAEVINQLQKQSELWDRTVIDAYKKRSMLLGKEITFTRGGEEFRGLAKDINESGHLIVEIDGKEEALTSGEVSLKMNRGGKNGL